jgi:hypothetical protein
MSAFDRAAITPAPARQPIMAIETQDRLPPPITPGSTRSAALPEKTTQKEKPPCLPPSPSVLGLGSSSLTP